MRRLNERKLQKKWQIVCQHPNREERVCNCQNCLHETGYSRRSAEELPSSAHILKLLCRRNEPRGGNSGNSMMKSFLISWIKRYLYLARVKLLRKRFHWYRLYKRFENMNIPIKFSSVKLFTENVAKSEIFFFKKDLNIQSQLLYLSIHAELFRILHNLSNMLLNLPGGSFLSIK